MASAPIAEAGGPEQPGHRPDQEPGAAPRTRRVEIAVAVLASLAFSLFCWRHLLAHPRSRSQSTGGEEGIYLWYLGHAPWSLLHGHNPFVSNAINYPAGVNLLWNTSLLTPGLILAPVTELGGVVLAYNLALILALWLSVLAAYAAARRLVRWWPAALVAGAFVAISPYLMSQARGHLNLILMPIPPLLLLVGDELLVRQRMRPARLGLLLAALVVLQVGMSTEILASSAAVAVVGVLVLAALGRAEVTRARVGYAARALGVAVAAALVVLAVPFYYLFFGAQHLTGQAQASDRFRADLLSPIVPTPVQALAPHSLTQTSAGFLGNSFENTGYLGVTLLALVVAIVVVLRRVALVRWLGVTALASLILSFGSSLAVDGKGTGAPLPFRLLTSLPLFSSGTAVRYSYYTLLLCALIVGVGVDHARGRVASTPEHGRLLAVGMPAAVLLAAAPLVPNVLPFKAVAATAPAFYTGPGVRAVPAGSVLLTYPYLNRFESEPMTWQALAHFRYLQIGDYAITPGKNGRGVFDVQTATAFVETRISISTVLAMGSIQVRAMTSELRRWNVRTVAVTMSAPNADLAVAFFTQLLHEQPTVTGGVAAFYDAHV